jgi:hypothetical protein
MVAVQEMQHLDSDSSSLIPFLASIDDEKIVPFRPNQRLDRDDAVYIEKEATTSEERDGTDVVGQVAISFGIYSPLARLEPDEQGRVVRVHDIVANLNDLHIVVATQNGKPNV